MKRIAKAFCILLSLLFVIGLFAGCQSADSASPPRPEAKSASEAVSRAAAGGVARSAPTALPTPAPSGASPAASAESVRSLETPSASPAPGADAVAHGEARIERRDLSVGRGQKDDTVSSIQRLLIHYGYLAEGAADGVFGKNTEKAVASFQEINGLWVTGVIDGETYDALYDGIIQDGKTPPRAVVFWSPDAKPMFTPSPTPVPTAGARHSASPEPTATPAVQAPEDDETEMVWIPRSGKRYHRRETCSNMKNPKYVTIGEAQRRGYTPCKNATEAVIPISPGAPRPRQKE